MDETKEPEVLEQAEPTKRAVRIRWTDIAIFAAIIAGATALTLYSVDRMHKNHEISQAQRLSTQVVSALAKQNTAKLLSLGDKNFKANNTPRKLSDQLTFKTSPPITFAAMYGDTKPAVDMHLLLNNSRGQHVVFIYRYDKLKVPLYIRIDTVKPPHDNSWHLQALGASPDESSLTNPLPAGASSV